MKYENLLLAVMLVLTATKAWGQDIQITPDGQYEYIINDDQLSATIIRFCGPDGELSIPSTIDGLLVTTIGEAAFSAKGLMGTLSLPPGLRRIELDAFSMNSGLTRVDIPASVCYIDPYAFFFCNGVIDVYLYHVYPDITTPPVYHELNWSDPYAQSFAGPSSTIIHIVNGTFDAHADGTVSGRSSAIHCWHSTNPASVVDDIPLPETLQFSIGPSGYDAVYSTTGWAVPAGITAYAVVWDDIAPKNRDGREDEEASTPTRLIHYGWDADNPWQINVSSPTHRYVAGETVPAACGVVVKGNQGTYEAQLDYYAPEAPFGNLLHGRDFPSVTDYPSTETDNVVSNYGLGLLGFNDRFGFLWESFISHGNEQGNWARDNGSPFVAEANKPWLALTDDNNEGQLSEPQDAHFFITFSDNPTGIEDIAPAGNADGFWTDMTGRRFHKCPATPGIYIHNGRKTVIR